VTRASRGVSKAVPLLSGATLDAPQLMEREPMIEGFCCQVTFTGEAS
jgi:hypothetical protein